MMYVVITARLLMAAALVVAVKAGFEAKPPACGEGATLAQCRVLP